MGALPACPPDDPRKVALAPAGNISPESHGCAPRPILAAV